jgi:hypothetical protein
MKSGSLNLPGTLWACPGPVMGLLYFYLYNVVTQTDDMMGRESRAHEREGADLVSSEYGRVTILTRIIEHRADPSGHAA